ncbi:MAG: YbaK/EbsC family protein [Acidobacteria bacterium]|nr:YbaK/EbsC family protein [Acidobacteriota bacterium]
MLGTQGLHPSALAVAQELERQGAKGPVRQFSASTKTAKDAATALGCDVGAIASCLVFLLDGDPIVIIKSGAFRVQPDRFLQLTGAQSLSRANAEQVRAATGQPIGGVSPVNWPGPLRVFIDRYLAEFTEIWAACGTPNAVFATHFEELITLTGAQVVDLGAP